MPLDSLIVGFLNEAMFVAAADPSQPEVTESLETAIDLLIQLWPLWVLVALVYMARALLENRRSPRKRRRAAARKPQRHSSPSSPRRGSQRSLPPVPTAAVLPGSIQEIDKMTGTQFEKRLELLFRDHGYDVRHTGRLGDYGGDLVVEREGTRSVVQAKRSANEVGLSAVREALAAKGIYECTEAMVVTNATFTWRARKLADANGVVLWDRQQLIALLQSTNGGAATLGSATRQRACARCGSEVSGGVIAFCLAHPELFGGLVYCYQHQREFKRRR